MINGQDDDVHHLPSQPPARTRRRTRTARPAPSRAVRRLWAPLLLACTVAAIALTAAVGGGTLPGLPGLSDASSATDTARAAGSEPAAAPSPAPGTAPGPDSPAATLAVPPTSNAPAPEPSAAPSTEPAPSGATTSGTPSPSSTDPAPTTTASVAAPAPEPAPAPAPAPAPTAAAAPVAAGPEGQVLALVNTARAGAGCAPVTADAGLAAVARAHSADMRDRGYFSHVDPDGRDPFQRAAAAGLAARAENIASGQPDATAVMAAWMDSPGHRRNILDCSLGSLGVGVATGSGGPWWTQLFG